MVGMEAAIVSSVICGTLKTVANKLAPLLIKEYSSIVGVAKDLQDLHDLVEEINCWLETVGDKAMARGPSFNWLKKLKDVSYDVDDLVDEVYLEAEKPDPDGDGRKHIVARYLRTEPKSFIFQCKAAHKIKAIKKRFAAIVKQRTEFSAIANSVPPGHPVQRINKTTRQMPTLPIVDEASIIGRDQEKHQIISKLLDTNDQQKIKIVSIIGLGGSGKTTLAKLVFKDANVIEKCFEFRVWVHVSQEFDVEKLIEKLFEAVAGEKSECYPLQEMSKVISNRLRKKKYLLVLDDVWTEDRISWDEFMVHLNNGESGSRILITTRSRKVAEVVESTYLFDLPFLSEVDSWQVFEQSFGMTIKGLDSEFLRAGKENVDKCGGVPLAIKVLAGVLRDKKHIEEWQAMGGNNLLHVEDKEYRVTECLMLSYSHMPSHLKQCFIICSVFPKGHVIDKEQLVDLWIAHDIITLEDGADCLEYIGHNCFNSLVQICLLQDVYESYWGRVECKMHDLVHDFAQFILADEISLVLPKEATSSTKSYRYFSLIGSPVKLPPENLFEKARAIFIAGGEDFKFGRAMQNAKHLRSITMEYHHTTLVPTTILQIKNLKYLSISGFFRTIPEAISDIWSLQSLHIVSSPCFNKLPESIGKLHRLRILNMSNSRRLQSLPKSIGDCHMISFLDLSRCTNFEWLPHSIGRCKRIRVLRLRYTQILSLPSSITLLGNLECLDLFGCSNLEELPEDVRNLKKLQLLNLTGCNNLRAMPEGIGQRSQLHNLSTHVGKGQNSAHISELAIVSKGSEDVTISGIASVRPYDEDKVMWTCLKQKNSKVLKLYWEINDEDKVNTKMEQTVIDCLEPPSGVKRLGIGSYVGEQYARWMLRQVGPVVQAVPQFPCLTKLKLWDFPNLKDLEGLVGLPCLEELELSTMPSLESISGGPFPSLVKLLLSHLHNLGEMWLVTENTLAGGEEGGGCSNHSPCHLGQVQIGSRLAHLDISICPKLVLKPYLPSSLEHLELTRSNEQLMLLPNQSKASSGFPPCSSLRHLKELKLKKYVGGWEMLQHMVALEFLKIDWCPGLTELPESLQSLTSLKSLHIDWCSNIQMLPEWLGELQSLQKMNIDSCGSLVGLPPSLQRLTSLQELGIRFCYALCELPECLGDLRSLLKLEIEYLKSLTCLPQSMCHLSSLEELNIIYCPGIKSLPEWIQDLTPLQRLEIKNCPDLERRCERGKGEDWHLISHIPQVSLGKRVSWDPLAVQTCTHANDPRS